MKAKTDTRAHAGRETLSDVGLTRRKLLALTAMTGVGVGLRGQLVTPAIAQAKPIKIGVLAPLSGVYSSLGTNEINGVKMFFDEQQSKVAGRAIDLVIEDEGLDPQTGLRKARKLVEVDQVDMLLGVLNSSIGYAVKEYAIREKKVWVTFGAGADGIFKKKNNSPYAFRSDLSNWQCNQPMGAWIADKGYKRVFVCGPDYAMGHESINAATAGLTLKGAEKVGEVFAPLGTTDYAPYLAQIKRTNPDLVYAAYAGSDAARFVQQYAKFGLRASIPLAGYGYLVEEDVLPAEGDAALGINSGLNWAYGLDIPANRRFVADYRKRYTASPTIDSAAGYVSAQVVHEALKSLSGDIPNQLALSEAVAKVKIDTPRGPFSFDPETHNVIQNVYIREVVKDGDELHNKVIVTHENVRDPGI